MSLGDAAINLLSLVGAEIALRGAGITARGIQFLTKSGRIKKITKFIKNSQNSKKHKKKE